MLWKGHSLPKPFASWVLCATTRWSFLWMAAPPTISFRRAWRNFLPSLLFPLLPFESWWEREYPRLRYPILSGSTFDPEPLLYPWFIPSSHMWCGYSVWRSVVKAIGPNHYRLPSLDHDIQTFGPRYHPLHRCTPVPIICLSPSA